MAENILTRILASKRREVTALKQIEALDLDSIAALPQRPSMRQALLESPTGIIAEFKRQSPSKGLIHPNAMAADVVPGYQKAGAAASSVLTDTPFFGGSLTDLAIASTTASLPLLRKDFVVDEFQIAQARLYGASAILLIAAALSAEEISRFTAFAHSLNLDVLLELHDIAELDKVCPEADMIGINHRNLATFKVDTTLSERLLPLLPANAVKVAESGLTSIHEVRQLRQAGFRGFLIGETFMKHEDPAEALRKFLDGTL